MKKKRRAGGGMEITSGKNRKYKAKMVSVL